jgi:hypothetical protein
MIDQVSSDENDRPSLAVVNIMNQVTVSSGTQSFALVFVDFSAM